MLFLVIIASTEVLNFLAIENIVSPGCTTYVNSKVTIFLPPSFNHNMWILLLSDI